MTGVILLNEMQLAMGTIIEAVGRAGGHGLLRSSSAPQLTDDAVVSCLAHADRTADELELLIDVGIYACGMLSAVELIDDLIEAGVAHRGVVVASDVGPDPDVRTGVESGATGGAMLLAGDDARPGFTGFHFTSFPDDANPLECAEEACTEFAGLSGFELEDVDLLVAHGSVPAFPGRLAERLGIGHDRVAALTKSLDRAHTAAPALAIEPFVRGDELSDGNVLFVSVGAGNSVAAATYQHR